MNEKIKAVEALPDTYEATASEAPVSRVICGVPVTYTVSEKFTVTFIRSGALYDPFVVVELTLVTVAALVSTTSALFAASELVAAGAANVRAAS